MRTIIIEVNGDATVKVDGTLLGSTPPQARRDLAPVVDALGLLSSVIKSGERWSAACEDAVSTARVALGQ
jgi:hypothetical protein